MRGPSCTVVQEAALQHLIPSLRKCAYARVHVDPAICKILGGSSLQLHDCDPAICKIRGGSLAGECGSSRRGPWLKAPFLAQDEAFKPRGAVILMRLFKMCIAAASQTACLLLLWWSSGSVSPGGTGRGVPSTTS